MSVIEVNEGNFEQEVLNSSSKVLVDFNASWCGPCKMLRPILDEIATDGCNFKIVSVNIDDNMNLANTYNVSSIPCLVVMENGKEVNINIGLIQKDDILKLMSE